MRTKCLEVLGRALIILFLVSSCKSSGSAQLPATGGEYEVPDRVANQRQDSLMAEKYALKLGVKPSGIKKSLVLYKFIDKNLNTPCSAAPGASTTTDTKFAQQLYKKVYGRKIPGTYNELKHSNLLPKFSTKMYLAEGDILFFETEPKDSTTRQQSSSNLELIGVYLKNKKFVTCSGRDGAVAIDNLDLNYWNRRFKMAGRLR